MFYKASVEIFGGVDPKIDPRRNRYEEVSQVIMHILMAASAGDETALKMYKNLKISLLKKSFLTPWVIFSAHSQGVDMNIGDFDGRTALHLVAAEGHIRCARFLLDVCKVKHNPKDRYDQ